MEKTPYSPRTTARRSRLQLVHPRIQGNHAPAIPALRGVPLDARPCRPGELPQRLVLACDPGFGAQIARQAAGHGIPVELWGRIAVEAARVRDDIAMVCARPRSRVEAHLNMACKRRPPLPPGAGELGLYVLLLLARAPRQREPLAGRDTIGLMVPDTVRCAWLSAAAAAGLTLAEWVAARLRDAPGAAVEWEIASAAWGRDIGEWGYRCWAARRPDNAEAHTLD